MLPRIMVLSGGGIKAVSHIGALQRLEVAGMLVGIRSWIGLSAGALVAFSICIGYTLPEIHDICNRFDFAALQDPAPEGFLSFLDHYGIDTGDKLYRFIHALLTVRGFAHTTTFAELAVRSHKDLRIVATNMTTGQPIIYSATETPTVQVADALRASMSLPFYFWPIHDETGQMLVDGGVCGNYPMNLLTVEEQSRAIGILLNQQIVGWSESGPDSYILRLYEIINNTVCNLLMRTFENRTIMVPTPQISMIKFTLDAADRAALWQAGADAADRFIAGRRLSVRRSSI